MNTVEFGKPYDAEISLALGYFDGLHLGHRKLIEKVKELSDTDGTVPAVSTFSDCPNRKESIYNYHERRRMFADCGVGMCLTLYYSRVCGKNGVDFFHQLISLYRIKNIVCGENYTFGCDLSGVGKLARLCAENNIRITVLPLLDYCGVRVSSTAIKSFLKSGDVDAAKKMLTVPYHIRGEVTYGDGRGHRIGVPTVNLDLPMGMMEIKRGVYGTYTRLDGEMYRSVTNYGARPTFSQNKFAIETNILDYGGDSLLGREITVYFHRYLRPIRKFTNAEELVNTIAKDKEWKDLC